ncbi:MAG TPA: tetratricopeptide repeat protein [Verrucomicrobiae bacterium]|jgi:tetratricopeptide (TPR) repeat protein
MKSNVLQKFLTACLSIFLVVSAFADTTNPPAMSRDETSGNFLQLQEQLHAAQLAIQRNQQVGMEAAASNLDLLTSRLQSLEQTVSSQRAAEADATRKSQQWILLVAGIFGLTVLGGLLLMVYLQSRAFTQIAQIAAQPSAALANASAVHQLAAPGRATVETANTRLLEMVGQLNDRIQELENSQRLLPPVTKSEITVNPLAEGQKNLDENAPEKALAFFDDFLARKPEHIEALLKKAEVLEKLGRAEDALSCYEQALAIRKKHAQNKSV